jgi:peptidoglycan/xylan/chitin deacetylase (PgdA/CDA1 family)
MTSRRHFLAGAAAVVLAAACSDGGGDEAPPSTTTSTLAPTTTTVPPTTTTTVPTGPATFVSSGPTDTGRVALTFHTSGDLGLAGRLRDTLDAREVVMTAFVVGQWLDANPTWAAELTGAGHELANHSYTHPDFDTLTPSAMADEITRCRDTLVRLSGAGGQYFRPSGTADGTSTPSPEVLAAAGAAGYRTVLGFDVDPLDYQDPGAAAITERVLGTVGAGSIVSLHFDHPGTIDALPAILDGIVARGLQPGTVTQLFGA